MSKNLKILCLLPVYNYNDKTRGHTAEYSIIYRSLKKKYSWYVLYPDRSTKDKTIFAGGRHTKHMVIAFYGIRFWT